MRINGRKNYKPGPKDECASPPYSVVPLLICMEWYRSRLEISKRDFIIWEPAIGMGEKRHTGLIDGLEHLGYRVFTTRFEDFVSTNFDDVDDRCNRQLGSKIRMIVTNPPFSVALKRGFINQCNKIYKYSGTPFALLMNTTTVAEKINGQALKGCALHIPFGRICFGMPNKGWGTVDQPTKSTFSTNWFSVGLADRYGIYYDTFDVSDHFKALDRFYAGETYG